MFKTANYWREKRAFLQHQDEDLKKWYEEESQRDPE